MIRLFFILSFIPGVAFAMADGTPPVYGRPTLYGEYENISGVDTARIAAMYGAAPKNAADKMPVKAKKVASKKAVAKKKSAKKVAAKKSVTPRVAKKDSSSADVIVVPPREKVMAITPQRKEPPKPDAAAVAIAGAAVAETVPTIESFCERRGRRPMRVPDGYVLMPGRPDLMSCVDK